MEYKKPFNKIICRLCKEQFDQPKTLYKHLQEKHSAGPAMKENRTCPICGVESPKYENYRDHMLYMHGQRSESHKLTFKSLNDFLLWKAEQEKKHNCQYVLQNAPKLLPSNERKFFYHCDRAESDRPKSREKKRNTILKKSCPSMISVVEATGILKVEYWDTHTGHGAARNVSLDKDELSAAISSVEMVHAIDAQDFEESFDSDIACSTDIFSNSSSRKFSHETFSGSPSTKSFSKSSSFAGKTDPVKKNTVLYSLASVACGKVVVKKSVNLDKSKENSETQNTVSSPNGTDSTSTSLDHDVSLDLPETSNAEEGSSLKSTLNIPITVATVPITPVPASNITSVSSLISTSLSNNIQLSSFTPVTSINGNSNITVVTSVPSTFPNTDGAAQSALPKNMVPISPLVTNNGVIFTVLPGNMAPVTKTMSNIAGIKTSVAQNLGSSTLSNIASVKTSVGQNLGSTIIAPKNVPIVAKPMPLSTTLPSLLSSNSNVISTVPVASNAALNGQVFVLGNQGTLKPNQSGVILCPSAQNVVTLGNIGNSVAKNASPSEPKQVGQNISIASTPIIERKAVSVTNSLFTNPSNVLTTTANNKTFTNLVFSPQLAPVSNVSSSSGNNVVFSTLPPGMSFVNVNNRLYPINTNSTVMSKISAGTPISTPFVINNSPTVKNLPASLVSSTVVHQESNKQPQSALNSSVVGKTVSNVLKDTSTITPSVAILTGKTTKVSIPKLTKSPITYSKENMKNKISSENSLISKSKKSPLKSKKGTSSNDVTHQTKVDSPVSSVPASTSSILSSRVSSNVSNKLSNKNSSLNTSSGPMTSTPIKIPPLPKDSGTLLFESSGNVYMLEPVENEPSKIQDGNKTCKVGSNSSEKEVKNVSVQTMTFGKDSKLINKLAKSNSSLKRAAHEDDTEVLQKVKYYQLEMSYLSSQEECKRLKVELAKERFKNKELFEGNGIEPNVPEDELNGKDQTNGKKSSIQAVELIKALEKRCGSEDDGSIYSLMRTSVLRSMYKDIEELCEENKKQYQELQKYRNHDKFYKFLRQKLEDEEF